MERVPSSFLGDDDVIKKKHRLLWPVPVHSLRIPVAGAHLWESNASHSIKHNNIICIQISLDEANTQFSYEYTDSEIQFDEWNEKWFEI